MVADKAYSSRANRTLLRRRGIPHTIPEPADQQTDRLRRGRPCGFDADVYRQRNAVERGWSRLKQWRGIATSYDKTATNRGGILLAVLLI